MVTLKEALKVDEQVLHAPEPHCPARPLVVVHVAAGAPRGLATLNVLLRGVTRADGVLVLVAEIAVFDTALREWCLLATACRLSVLSNSWQAEREDARHGVGRLGHTQDVAAPLHTVLQQALEVVPTMCAEGLALLRSGMSADVSFARRLEGVSKERVSWGPARAARRGAARARGARARPARERRWAACAACQRRAVCGARNAAWALRWGGFGGGRAGELI